MSKALINVPSNGMSLPVKQKKTLVKKFHTDRKADCDKQYLVVLRVDPLLRKQSIYHQLLVSADDNEQAKYLAFLQFAECWITSPDSYKWNRTTTWQEKIKTYNR